MPAEMDIEIQRNGDYLAGWQLTDDQTGDPLDITGWTLALEVRTVAGIGGAAIASATFQNRVDAEGYFDILIEGADFSAVPNPMNIANLAYDFVATDDAGARIVEVRGHIILTPGVTA